MNNFWGKMQTSGNHIHFQYLTSKSYSVHTMCSHGFTEDFVGKHIGMWSDISV